MEHIKPFSKVYQINENLTIAKHFPLVWMYKVDGQAPVPMDSANETVCKTILDYITKQPDSVKVELADLEQIVNRTLFNIAVVKAQTAADSMLGFSNEQARLALDIRLRAQKVLRHSRWLNALADLALMSKERSVLDAKWGDTSWESNLDALIPQLYLKDNLICYACAEVTCTYDPVQKQAEFGSTTVTCTDAYAWAKSVITNYF